MQGNLFFTNVIVFYPNWIFTQSYFQNREPVTANNYNQEFPIINAALQDFITDQPFICYQILH